MAPEEFISGIKRLRDEKNAFILAHNYQIGPIQDLADFVADSLAMAKKATEVDNPLIVVCGADFMAETAKILNPEKKILTPTFDNACPMAWMLKKDELIEMKKKHPDAKVVLYVNSSAECRALADVCCTSANALEVIKGIDSKKVIFGPDKNLAAYVAKRCDKEIIPIPKEGYCFVHIKFSREEIEKIKAKHPDAVLMVHPECEMEIQDMADFIGSTSQMLNYSHESDAKEFIVGTEVGLIHTLKKKSPGKEFYPACAGAICTRQKEITLEWLHHCLKEEKYEIELPKEVIKGAQKALQRMLEIV